MLILGSGNVVHNLSMIDWDQLSKKTPSWALDFDRYVKYALDTGKDDMLINYSDGQGSKHSVATNEHYLPILYACALRENGETVKYFHEGFQHASISMRCFSIGL